MMSGEKNYHVVLCQRPGVSSPPSESNFRYEECSPPPSSLAPGEIVVRTCNLSIDPAMRCLLNEDSGVDYMSSCQLGERITGTFGVGVVEASCSESLAAGDLVTRFRWPWALRFMDKDTDFQKLDRSVFGSHPSLAIGAVVGIAGLLGMREKGHVSRGANQTCVVSGAAGLCGSIAGQVAILDGCSSVVGICGSQEKAAWLTKDLGFTAAINYREDDVAAKLQKSCPQGIDVYFDNVGGEISDTVIAQMNDNSHVVLCGQISQYNKDVPYPPPLPPQTQQTLQQKNITRDRFLMFNYSEKFPAAMSELTRLMLEGKVQYRETVADGLQNAGAAFVSMMAGGNIGKQVVHVSDP